MITTISTGFFDGESPRCDWNVLDLADARRSEPFKSVILRWESLRQDGYLPRKLDFSPEHIRPATLPLLMLLDVEHDPMRFRYRLTGTEVERLHNRNFTGIYVDEQNPKSLRDKLIEDYTRLAEERVPQYFHMVFQNTLGYLRDIDVLRLPLGDNKTPESDRVAHILIVVKFAH